MLNSDGQQAGVEHITPMRAQEYLRHSDECFKNRPPVLARIKLYASQMRAGLWKLNGESIKFDEAGVLIDGQHRLMACIEANVPFNTWVVRRVAREVFPTLDTGRARGAGDNLGMLGATFANSTASAIGWIIRLKNGLAFHNNTPIPNERIVEFYQEHPEIKASMEISYKSRKLIPPGPGGGLHFLFCDKDRAEANKFFDDLANGVGLGSNNAVHMLREQLQENRASKQKIALIEVVARTIRAWNYRRQNVHPKIIKGTVGTGVNRQFPEIV